MADINLNDLLEKRQAESQRLYPSSIRAMKWLSLMLRSKA